MPAYIRNLCQLWNFVREFTEKCFAGFYQSSHTIYLRWYCSLLFLWEFSSVKSKGRKYIFMSSIMWQKCFFNWKLTRNYTWLGIIWNNDALIGNVSETESNSETNKYLPEDSLESKSDSHENGENISLPFLKKVRSKHPKNLFFGQLKLNSIRNKFELVQEIVQNTFFLSVRLKLIPPSQINSFVFLNIVYFERTVMLVVEDYFSM